MNVCKHFWSWDCTLSIIFDFQSLLAGLVAILAAIFAARPVWKQLNELQIQRKIDIKRYRQKRLIEIRELTEKLSPTFQKFYQNVVLAQYPNYEETEKPANINPEFAHVTEQEAFFLSEMLSKLQQSKRLPKQLENALEQLNEGLQALGSLMSLIHEPHLRDFFDPDFQIKNPEKAESEAHEKSMEAQRKISEALSELYGKREAFEAALLCFQKSLREQIQQIDQELLDIK